ncbi:MAG: hypothetical protein AAGD38_06750 [Acidobacteriota bacterium]
MSIAGRSWLSRADTERRLARAEATIADRRTDRDERMAAAVQRLFALWLLGRFDECWSAFHDLPRDHEHVSWLVEPLHNAWTGTLLGDRSLTVHATRGGLGDLIQMARFIALLPRGGGLVVETRPALLRLMQTSFDPAIVWTSRIDAAPPGDVDTQMDFLPFLLGVDLATIGGAVPYLRPDPVDVERWATRLASWPRPWIGVCWTNQEDGSVGDPRCLALESLAPLVRVVPATYISLIERPPPEITNSVDGRPILDVAEPLGDFADVAALIANLDHVVTIDTAVAHVAGGLGQPTHLLLPHEPFPNWLLGFVPGGTAWYPTMRTVRQTSPGEWGDVVATVVAELSDRLG